MIPLWERDIPGYNSSINNGEIPSITPYTLENGRVNSAIIVCPGGGYVRRAEHEGEPVALWLNSIGISSFVLNYRVAPYRYPYPLLDIKRAIRVVRFNVDKFHIDPNRIGILGFSAGGHLACMSAVFFDDGDSNSSDPIERISSKPNALILCYPVISFLRFYHKGSMLSLLGEDHPYELREALSCENRVTENTPPTFIWHTADDASVPVENSLLFVEALRRFDIPFELHIFQSGRHGLGLAKGNPYISKWTDLCEIWLRKISFIE
ncbi:MAG: alpha/beta hydrolase [bacterium]|nr:alpha/beta hydrolase [bacterium]